VSNIVGKYCVGGARYLDGMKPDVATDRLLENSSIECTYEKEGYVNDALLLLDR
jgi:hypothetical protein